MRLTWYPNGSCYGYKNYNVSVEKERKYVFTIIATHCFDGERLVYQGAYRPDHSREVISEAAVDDEIVSEVRNFASKLSPLRWDAPDKKYGWDDDDLYDDLVALGKMAEGAQGRNAKLTTYECWETVKDLCTEDLEG